MLLESHLICAPVVVDNEGIPNDDIPCSYRLESYRREDSSEHPWLERTPVFAWYAATVQAHGALLIGKPFKALPELTEPEWCDYFLGPVVANSVNEPPQLSSDHLDSSVAAWTLAAVHSANTIGTILTGHFVIDPFHS
jgi:hypothetical protein